MEEGTHVRQRDGGDPVLMKTRDLACAHENKRTSVCRSPCWVSFLSPSGPAESVCCGWASLGWVRGCVRGIQAPQGLSGLLSNWS